MYGDEFMELNDISGIEVILVHMFYFHCKELLSYIRYYK